MHHWGNGVFYSDKSPCLLLLVYHIGKDPVAKCNVMHHTKCIIVACGNNFQNERKRSRFFSLHIHKQHIHVAAIKYVHECWDERSENEKSKNNETET